MIKEYIKWFQDMEVRQKYQEALVYQKKGYTNEKPRD